MTKEAAEELSLAIFLSVIVFCSQRCGDNYFQREHEKEMAEPCVCESCEIEEGATFQNYVNDVEFLEKIDD